MFGQPFLVSETKKTVYTKINEPFHHADSILRWSFKSEGLGINKEIINICIRNKFALSVSCNNKHYKFDYNTIKKILNTLKTDYFLKSGVQLHILPMTLSYNAQNAMDDFYE